MMQVLINQIEIGDRIREEEDVNSLDFQLLKQSVADLGLIQPIVVVWRDCNDEDLRLPTGVDTSRNVYKLIAGYRRLRVCKELGFIKIPVHEVALEDNEPVVLELMENLRRKSMTWQEELKAKATVFDKMKDSNRKYRAKDLAALLGQSEALTSLELTLWRMAKKNQDLLSVERKTDALRMACDMREMQLNATQLSDIQTEQVQKASAVGLDVSALNYISDASDKDTSLMSFNEMKKHKRKTVSVECIPILYPDAMTMLKRLPEHSMDLCCTDPPFGEDIQRASRVNKYTYAEDYDDTPERYFDMIIPVIHELKRVMQPGAHVYMFLGIEKFQDLSKIFKAEGFSVWSIPLIWYKLYPGDMTGPNAAGDYYPARTYEAILYAFAPGQRRRLRWCGQSNVLSEDVVQPSSKIHPMQKPVSLYKSLMMRSGREGDLVIDPFCGSGASLIAAMELNMRSIGAEIREKYRVGLVKRIHDAYSVLVKEIK